MMSHYRWIPLVWLCAAMLAGGKAAGKLDFSKDPMAIVSFKNATKKTLYGSFFYKRNFPKFEAEKSSETFLIKARATLHTVRPEDRPDWSRVFVFSTDPSFINKKKLGLREYDNTPHIHVEPYTGSTFTLKKNKKGQLYGKPPGFLGTISRLKRRASTLLDEAELKIHEGITSTVGSFVRKKETEKRKIHIRVEKKLSHAELIFQQARDQVCLKAMRTVLDNANLAPRQIPRIGLVMSGGGHRAMICAAGLMDGLEQAGLWDLVYYTASLSGSTWAVMGMLLQEMTPHEFGIYLKEVVATNLSQTPLDIGGLEETFRRRILSDQEVTLVDLWGVLIGNMLFRNLSPAGKDQLITDLPQEKFRRGELPLPLFSMVLGRTTPLLWFEVGPFEVGCSDIGAYCPVEGFGRFFVNGVSKDYAPPLTAGFYLGTFGSAMAVDLKKLAHKLSNVVDNKIISKILRTITKETEVGKLRMTHASVHNFMYQAERTPFARSTSLGLVDAGLSINLPFPILFHRNIDIYIVCDASANIKPDKAGDFQQAMIYAKEHGYVMPPVTMDGIGTRPFSVFKHPTDPHAPIILFIPNRKPFSTYKFGYTAQEYDELFGGIRDVIIEHKNEIINAIREKIAAKENNIAK